MEKREQLAQSKPASRRTAIILALLLVALTAAVYWQAAGFGLLNYDDNEYVSENLHVTAGLSGEGVLWAFTARHAAYWAPLTWISLMLDSQLGHGSPGAYHVTNVILHGLSVLLLYLTLAVATKAWWRSAFVAALFAIHPLHVESVAWVTERKDVLSTVFWMLTMLIYVRCAGRLTRRTQALLATVFAMGLLAKAMLVSLPLVLLMMDYWPLRRLDRVKRASLGLVWEKGLLITLAAASCTVTYWAQLTGGATRPIEAYPVGVRLANAAVAYVRYLGKAIWPANLAPFYPHPGASLPLWQVIGSVAALVAVTLAVIRFRQRAPYLLVGWLWYVVTLLPVIGIVQVGDQALADRYSYVPLIGIFIAIAWGVPALAGRGERGEPAARPRAQALGVVGVALVVVLAFAAHKQVGYWRSSKTLFAHAVRVTPRNYLAYNNLGAALLDDAVRDSRNLDRGLLDEAMRDLQTSLEIKPNYAEALYNLGTVFGRLKRTDEAMALFQKALSFRPDSPKVLNNVGVILLHQRQFARAEFEFRAAVKADPDRSESWQNLSLALYQQGRFDEAVEPGMRALQIRAEDVAAHDYLGNAFMQLGRWQEAAEQYEAVLKLNPGRVGERMNLTLVYQRLGRLDEAIEQARTVLQSQPDDPAVRAYCEKLIASRGGVGF